MARLVPVGPWPRYIDDGDDAGGFTGEEIEELLESLESNYLGWPSAMAPVIVGNPERSELGHELVNDFRRAEPESASHLARVTFLSDDRVALAPAPTPTLILQCSHDAIAPEVVVEYVHSRLPDSRLVLLDATGHCPYLSAPEETVAAIGAFLAA